MLSVREIKALVLQYGLGVSPRRLGQCFLVAPKMLERIARAGEITAEDTVLEIGSGLGALTDALVKTGAQLIGVEKDARFIKVLEDRFANAANFTLVHSDILNVDFAQYAPAPHGLIVMGNIPYAMTSPILEYLLKHRASLKGVVLTIQKEVAQRLVAQPGTKAYSSISLLVQVAFKPKLCFTIAPNAFYPQPNVMSAVIRLDPLEKSVIPEEDQTLVLKLVRAVFTHRRKILPNALATSGLPYDRERVTQALAAADIDPTARPENLTLQDFHRLALALMS